MKCRFLDRWLMGCIATVAICSKFDGARDTDDYHDTIFAR